MRTRAGKLELTRERIRLLQPDELSRIVGGPGPTGTHSADPDDRIGPTQTTGTCPTVETDDCSAVAC